MISFDVFWGQGFSYWSYVNMLTTPASFLIDGTKRAPLLVILASLSVLIYTMSGAERFKSYSD